MTWYGGKEAGERAKAAVKSKRRANREAAAPRFEGEDVSLDAIYARDNGLCYLCKLPVQRRHASLDHVVALVNGGTHTETNVRLAHRRCNSQKGARTGPRKKGLRRTGFRPKPKKAPEPEEGMF